MSDRVQFMLPKAENLLRLVNRNIVRNLKRRKEAKVNFPPLIERAYLITYETGVIPYRDYSGDEELG